jgi:hypothetical protein
VIELAAVVLAHARTRPDHHHKVNLLVNGLVTPSSLRSSPAAPGLGGPTARGSSAPPGRVSTSGS